MINNGYVNTSIQKAGVVGFPGCIEHTTMLWDQIKTAKNNKTELHVIWLDLENAYGSVRHQLLEKAMEFFWIPEDIKNLISTYFKRTYVRCSNNKYSTKWQKLNIGIMIGCVISPLLFVLVMKMILRSADVNTNQITGPSMKAFMDDVTLQNPDHTGDPPPRALQMGCYKNKAFEVPKFIVAERELQRNKVFCQWK